MTEVARFILLGPSSTKSLHVPLSITFALIYLVDVVGNMGTILLVLLDSHLHSPLYFFLRNLSLVDVGYSTAVIPTVLAGFLEGEGSSPIMPVLLRCSSLQPLPLWKASSWQQWPMTATQQCANPCITPSPWPQVRAHVWPQALGSSVFWLLLLMLGTHSISLFVRPMSSITFSVIFQQSCLWLVQIKTLMSWLFFLFQALISSLRFLLFWFPTCSYLSPFWSCSQVKDTRRLYPPVRPTLLQSPYFTGPSSSCTYSPVPATPWTQTKLHLCSIRCSSPCWTPWSIA